MEIEECCNNSPTRLHLGCGMRYLPGYCHVDIEAFPHVDKVCDIRNIHKTFEKESVEEIYSCHVLEHCRRYEILQILLRWNYVMKTGACLRIAVPDIGSVMEHYQKTGRLEDIMGLLYGGQKNEWDGHTVGFDLSTMRHFLKVCGFRGVERYDATEFLPEGYDDYSMAFLPHMQQSGRLVSLNVVCYKERNVESVTPEQRSEVIMKILGHHGKEENFYSV